MSSFPQKKCIKDSVFLIAKFKVVYAAKAERGLAPIPKKMQTRIWAAVAELSENPFPLGCKNLQGFVDLWRIRVGDYRIIYTVRNAELLILILAISDRKEAYRKS